jgi:FkbH-like protein
MTQDSSITQPLRKARSAWRDWIRSAGTPNIDIGIVASFTADALVPYLGYALLSAGWSPRIQVAPFNQIVQTLSSPQSTFGGSTPEVLLVLPRLDEFVGAELVRSCSGEAAAWPQAQEKLSELAAAVGSVRDNSSGTLIVGTLPPPCIPEFDLLHLDRLGAEFFEKTSTFWREAMDTLGKVRILDVRALTTDFGARHAFDLRTWYLYRQPFSELFFLELGKHAGRLISATRRASGKCAVIDCDNTIWGGVIGEDGMDGIRLGDEFPGSAYRDFQRLLLHLRRQGVFLAVCSKNNPEDVRKVFREHRAMLLRESDISAWAVGWRPKSEQIDDIAKELNIGTDALVFFDDSQYEIAEVSRAHPSLRCIQLPTSPEMFVSAARRAMAFDKIEITNDDRSRVDRYGVESRRSELRRSLPLQDFIKSLDLRVATTAVGADNIARVAQLVNKTNQFNLTGLRPTQDQIHAMVGSNDYIVRAALVSDKFGEYGLTCVGMLERRGHDWHILVFLLSCRVLGRSVETRFLSDLASEVLARGGDQITAEFRATGKNAVAADFLERHGFVRFEADSWHSPASELAEDVLVPKSRSDPSS